MIACEISSSIFARPTATESCRLPRKLSGAESATVASRLLRRIASTPSVGNRKPTGVLTGSASSPDWGEYTGNRNGLR